MKRILITLTLIALTLMVGAASAQEEVATVRVQLGWVHEYSAAGFYMAGANGHYGAENLNVELFEGGFGPDGFIDPIATLLAGEVEFANTDLLNLMEQRAAGLPLVAIGTINQRSPSSIISLPEAGIVTPEDLVGKTVLVADTALIGLEAMLGTVGVDPADVNIVPRTDFGVDPLVNGDVDALAGWIINEGVLLEEQGIEPNYIVLSDYGVDTYNTLIVTTEDMIANNPDVVQRFLRATIQGHEDVVSDPAKAAEVTITFDPETLVYEEQFNRINAFLPLIKPANSNIGVISAEVFDYNHEMLLEAGVLTEPLEDLSAAYDLSFLEAIYGELE